MLSPIVAAPHSTVRSKLCVMAKLPGLFSALSQDPLPSRCCCNILVLAALEVVHSMAALHGCTRWFCAELVHLIAAFIVSTPLLLLLPASNVCTRRQGLLMQERHRREVAEQDFEKASKAAAAEQARRNKEQVRVKEQQEVQQRLAAHRQGEQSLHTLLPCNGYGSFHAVHPYCSAGSGRPASL